MLLTRALEPLTSPRSRARGAEYFSWPARSSTSTLSRRFVYAVVRGSDDYVVRIELVDRAVRGTCTCPFFNDRLEPCKHLWAVALMCDSQRRTSAARHHPRPARFASSAFRSTTQHRTTTGRWTTRSSTCPHRPAPQRDSRRAHGPAGGRRWPPSPRRRRPTGIAADTLPGNSSTSSTSRRRAGDGASSCTCSGRQQKQNGDWGLPKPRGSQRGADAVLPEPDRDHHRQARGRAAGA